MKAFVTLLLVFLLATAGFTGYAQEVPGVTAPPTVETPGTKDESPLHPTMNLTRQRWYRGLDRIFEFDRRPLGNRIPVILVPGRAEEYQHNAWWDKLEDAGQRHPEFNRHYKLYVYLYDSSEELDSQAREFVRDMQRHFARLPLDRKMVLVTYSLGGLIAREAMADPYISNRVHTVFGIAVPYHGSPLFDPDWFSQYMRHPSPIRTFWDRFLYRTYLFNKSNLTRGLRWDNFDHSKPQFHARVAGDQLVAEVPQYKPHRSEETLKERLFIYASYLENSYTKSNQPFQKRKLPWYVLDKTVKLPKGVLGSVLPFYGGTVNSVFTYMNHQMSNIPTFTPDDPHGKNTHLYRFNDGAIPLSSMLYLEGRPRPYDNDLPGLVDALDIPTERARIFVNIDHMHIGCYGVFDRWRLRNTKDVLNPEDGARNPDDWVVYDLMKLLPAVRESEQAVMQHQAAEAIER